jgi:hypothetical protein
MLGFSHEVGPVMKSARSCCRSGSRAAGSPGGYGRGSRHPESVRSIAFEEFRHVVTQ